jgi:hypothetical protein
MERMIQIATKLSKAEQKKILGGGPSPINQTVSIDCFDGNMISMPCPAGYHGVVNNEQGSIKCCHYTIDCCYTWSCNGAMGLTYQGAACTMLMQLQQQMNGL